ncbi:hypothetical protein ACFE04_026254 [Oxalis oulophora]
MEARLEALEKTVETLKVDCESTKSILLSQKDMLEQIQLSLATLATTKKESENRSSDPPHPNSGLDSFSSAVKLPRSRSIRRPLLGIYYEWSPQGVKRQWPQNGSPSITRTPDPYTMKPPQTVNRNTRRLSLQDFEKLRKNGLCHRCRQPYHPRHECPNKVLRATIIQELDDTINMDNFEEVENEDLPLNADSAPIGTTHFST